MRKVYYRKLDSWGLEPETVLEAVEDLEEFLKADFGQNDWSVKFLETHFKICKDQIKKIQHKSKDRCRHAIVEYSTSMIICKGCGKKWFADKYNTFKDMSFRAGGE